MFAGPEQGLEQVDSLAGELDGYEPFHLAQADMLVRMHKKGEARHAYERALEHTQNQVEREFILEQMERL